MCNNLHMYDAVSPRQEKYYLKLTIQCIQSKNDLKIRIKMRIKKIRDDNHCRIGNRLIAIRFDLLTGYFYQNTQICKYYFFS